MYPLSVSSYHNGIYGLMNFMVFFIVLTIGFIFELGKSALDIDSKQTLSSDNNTVYVDVFITSLLPGATPFSSAGGSPSPSSNNNIDSGANLPKPHVFNSLHLESSLNVFKYFKSYLFDVLVHHISNYMVLVLKKKIIRFLNTYP
jgi:hypothetical protein